MSQDPKTNYLCHTAPGAKQQFIELLTQLDLFRNLPESLCSRIFDYAKFIELASGDRPVVEGMFDQEIFLLISGRLDVFIALDRTSEKLIDSMSQPFTLFGERCLLGQPRGASIQADGPVLLLGLDLSSLPDITEHLEQPELRLPDAEYQQNFDLYLVIANVLFERLVRLEHDQYKLDYKVREIQHRVKTHRKMGLKTRIYNEMITNKLHDSLRSPKIWARLVRFFGVQSVSDLLDEPLVDTEKLYNRLVSAQSIGELAEVDWMYLLLKQLSEQARYVPEYWNQPDSEKYLPDLLQMAICLSSLYEKLSGSRLLGADETLAIFLSAQDSKQAWSPTQWAEQVSVSHPENLWFSKAQIGLLLCEALIEWVGKANQAIASYVDYLSEMHSQPKQRVVVSGTQLVEQFEAFFQEISGETSEPKEAKQSAEPEGGVDDLLAQFGM